MKYTIKLISPVYFNISIDILNLHMQLPFVVSIIFLLDSAGLDNSGIHKLHVWFLERHVRL